MGETERQASPLPGHLDHEEWESDKRHPSSNRNPVRESILSPVNSPGRERETSGDFTSTTRRKSRIASGRHRDGSFLFASGLAALSERVSM